MVYHRNKDFAKGYEDVILEIIETGWSAARDKFLMDHPLGQTYSSLEELHYAEGGLRALLDCTGECKARSN